MNPVLSVVKRDSYVVRSGTMGFEDLPAALRDALRSLAQALAREGIRLFVFGSFARGDARPTSDLDLGFDSGESDPREILLRLRDRLDALPTIRPIDLVPFRDLSPSFRDEARRHILPLAPE